MQKIVLFALVCFFVCSLDSCKSKEESKADDISVSWKLISNFIDSKDGFEAKFSLVNHGDSTLNEHNWALFFNMSPRPITPNALSQKAVVQHINGDWYKLVPEKGFSLAPGDSIEIHYTGTEGVIKETDAPMGLYFVYYDQKGQESRVVEVTNFKVEPFMTRDQILRGRQDQLQLPTAEARYRKNEELTLLNREQLLPVLPTPWQMVKGEGRLTLSGSESIQYGKGLEVEAKFLAEKLKGITGKSFGVKPDSEKSPAQITLQTEPLTIDGKTSEAYQLQINKEGIHIKGSDASGVFYGIQSLLALMPVDLPQKESLPIELGYVSIADAPRFSFRSLHVDVARNFQTKETMLRIIDLLGYYKINHLLLYTTEDEGWRVEIDGLPELTEIGASRAHTAGGKNAPVLHPAYGSGPQAYAEGKHGSGYYTKADFIEILKYAKERHVKIIPELNFPGHARAAIKAMEARYQRLMKEGKPKEAEEYRLIDPDDKSVYLSAQAYTDNVVSVARESVYHFYEKVVDEYAKLYAAAGLKLDVIHAGGDEVAEGAWTQSPLALQLLKENPQIKDPKNLQGYFFKRLLPRLRQRGLQVHGWEEVALNKTADGRYIPNPAFIGQNVVPYIWNNLFDPDLGYRLANSGYPVVLCNVSNFYFDLAYNNDPKEPGLYWAGFVDARSNWEFAPYDMFKTTPVTAMGSPMNFDKVERLRPEARKNIIGVEAQLWSETIKGRNMIEYYMLPKLVGFAESAWARERPWEIIQDKTERNKVIQAGWNQFANTLAQRELPRMNAANYAYRVPAPGAVKENGVLKANIEYPGLVIRYTTDGAEPNENSTLYSQPVSVKGKVKLKAFDKSGKRTSALVVVED